MYFSYKGKEKQYAYAKESKREGSKVVSSETYLGKVADRELEVFYRPGRGFFTFDLETRQYGEPPSAFVLPRDPGRNRALAFGGAFFLNAFLHRTGMMELIDSLPFGNKDTVRAMVLFYVLSPLANCYAEQWYKAGIASLLYPQANLASQRISAMLEAVGTDDGVQNYLERQVAWVLGRLNPDRNILVDSTALENSVCIPLSRQGAHNGRIEVAVRFIAVVQRGGMPLFFAPATGNTVDVTTLPFAIETMKGMGVEVESCLMDAGYYCGSNLDMFYDDNHCCIIDYITRVKSNDKELKKMIAESSSTIDDRENYFTYDERILFIKKKQIFVGKNKDNPAWLYLGKDLERYGDELKRLPGKAARRKLSDDETYEMFRHGGLFALVSGRERPCGEILPKYYERQAAEQLFDFLKNYAKIIPLRCWKEETVRGHLLISYIAATVVTLLHLRLKGRGPGAMESLASLNFLKCTRYAGRIVVNPLEKSASDAFKAAGLECPRALPVAGGRLCYAPPRAADRPLEDGPAVQAGPSGAGQKEERKGKRGRPKGSKNRKTLEREALEAAQGGSVEKRRPGRPKGSKNRKTLEREAQARAEAEAGTMAEPKRGRGRPKGSKNRKTLEREAALKAAREAKYPPKRGRGRPKGSKNKKKEVVEASIPVG
jgi:hypothetical protein